MIVEVGGENFKTEDIIQYLRLLGTNHAFPTEFPEIDHLEVWN